MCLGTYIGLNLKLHVCEDAHHIGGHFGETIVEGTGITLRSRSEGGGFKLWCKLQWSQGGL